LAPSVAAGADVASLDAGALDADAYDTASPDAAAPDAAAPDAAALGADERFQAALASIFRPTAWTRVRVDEGLELHVRDDYRLPRNRAGDEELLRLLKAVLLDLEQRSKGRP